MWSKSGEAVGETFSATTRGQKALPPARRESSDVGCSKTFDRFERPTENISLQKRRREGEERSGRRRSAAQAKSLLEKLVVYIRYFAAESRLETSAALTAVRRTGKCQTCGRGSRPRWQAKLGARFGSAMEALTSLEGSRRQQMLQRKHRCDNLGYVQASVHCFWSAKPVHGAAGSRSKLAGRRANATRCTNIHGGRFRRLRAKSRRAPVQSREQRNSVSEGLRLQSREYRWLSSAEQQQTT